MKIVKKIFGTIVFLGIGLLLFVITSYLLRPLDNDFYRKSFTGFYGEKEDSLDVVVFGSSSADRYFNNPVLWEETNLTSYDLTTASQSCFMIEHMIDEVKKTQSPQLYIVETRKFIRAKGKDSNKKMFACVIDNMKYSANRIDLINYMTDDWEKRIQYYFDIISYHDNWENFSYKNLSYIDNIYTDPDKGWTNKTKICSVDVPNILPVEDLETMPIAEECEEALRSLLEKCQKEDIPVLFVATPYSIDEDSQKKNIYIKQIIEEAGYDFLDCNQYLDEIGLDFSQDFYDPRHVNMLGTEKTTRFIGNYIQEKYQLSTTHDEDVTEDWIRYAENNRNKADLFEAEMLGQTQSSEEEK